MRINLEDTLFCLVDVQEKLFPHIGNKDELLRTLPILVKGMKTLDVPIIVNAFKKSGKKNIVVAGIETHVCVLQTCIDLLENGFNVILVTNCCGSRTKLDHKMAIKRLIQAGAIPTTYESILFELTLDAKNRNSKQYLQNNL